jgi:hypothetical protein
MVDDLVWCSGRFIFGRQWRSTCHGVERQRLCDVSDELNEWNAHMQHVPPAPVKAGNVLHLDTATRTVTTQWERGEQHESLYEGKAVFISHLRVPPRRPH